MSTKKKFKTVNEAAHQAAKKFKNATPQDEVWRGADRPPVFGYGTKLNKAKGSPDVYKDGLGPPIKNPSSTGTKSRNRFKKTGYLA